MYSNTVVVTEEKLEIVRDATANGSLRPQIAKLTGVSKVTVWKYQKKMGLL